MKVKKYETCSGAGIVYNEDRTSFNEASAWVIDGASGLAKNIITNTSDAAWYSEWWNNYLKENANNFNKSVKQIFKDGIIEITKIYNQLVGDRELTKLSKPSAGIAFIRKNKNKLEYFILGDCMLSVNCNNKTKEYFLPELGKLDSSVISYMAKLYKNGDYENVLKTRENETVINMLAENRLKLNTPNGYWVLSFQEDAVDNALTGVIEYPNFDILLMTDGYYAISESYSRYSFSELFANVDKYSLQHIYDEIRKIENNDANCNNFPRFKKSDDATAVYIKYKE